MVRTMAGKFLAVAFCAVLAVSLGVGLAFAGSDDELFIVDGADVFVLMRVESGSGEMFRAVADPGDPEIEFASKGDSAMLTFDGDQVPQFVLMTPGLKKGEFFLTVDGKTYTMKEAITASGAKYEAVGDPSTTLWGKGRSVTLTVKGADYPGYEKWQPMGRIWRPGE